LAPLAVLPTHQGRGIGAPAGAFMVIELRPVALGEAAGAARCHPVFDEA